MVGVFFTYFALVSIAAGVLTVTLRHPVHCALSLLVLLMHVSGLFILLNAEFLWAVQVIVYVGAILVLYLFVLMLMNLKTDERYFHQSALYVLGPAVLGAGYVLYNLLRSPFDGTKGDTSATAVLQDGDTYAVGIKMFSDHLLQFEIVGIFLLGAAIGAIVLAKTPKQLEAERERS
ncbi:NADH-quinone oxidoreductase subunit J family protein [Candidatus Nitrospira nitrificans]|jgi:NADH-quinone oxidoreductase subunit J|uniref:NADH-quinone oxidoreductase subunit J n=1 Tax=Candidatus Nitrospira nitrificans TaxID=1742973 RepID=A0A0S4L795_9BACT|nr:NADH-quinone oxidoreductase subunit J [Candidatus Nitrospira nitrificans]CUS33692.1 NADH-quinone oxidoreductase, membrane subunit J [Candidatus Nitrospira nitrificans]